MGDGGRSGVGEPWTSPQRTSDKMQRACERGSSAAQVEVLLLGRSRAS